MLNFIEKEQNDYTARSMQALISIDMHITNAAADKLSPNAKEQVKADLVNKVKADCKVRDGMPTAIEE